MADDVGGAGGVGGPCVADAGMIADATVCTALMGFENCATYNAMLNDSKQQLGFQSESVVSSALRSGCQGAESGESM